MIEITEGKLVFTFPDKAKVTKYDDWSFYRNQLNQYMSFKAVDIIYVEG